MYVNHKSYIMNKPIKMQPLNRIKPRESVAELIGDVVFKTPTDTNKMRIANWMAKQQHARTVQDFLNTKKNTAYFVPRIIEIDKSLSQVAETYATGATLNSTFFDTLTSKDHDIIYNGIAHFINDIAEFRPVLNQQDFLVQNEPDFPADTTQLEAKLAQQKDILSPAETQDILRAYNLFVNNQTGAASVVFSHGDINENNVLYDPEKQQLSIIDLADSKYENVSEMFNRNYARLGWLDIDRLIATFNKLPHKTPINTTENAGVTQIRQALKNVIWSLKNIKNDKAYAARVQVFKDETKRLQKVLQNISCNTTLLQNTGHDM